MAGRGVSPGAALLRSSRMFSMPAPIPAPPGDYSSATKHYSPTATINYPTHLTVTTTSSSRINGDWGFKRPFPLKTTTNTTYPLVRVRQVDSTEHVTDFQSASDHTITLQKYQELNLPISVPMQTGYNPLMQTSVFEESGDVTALNAEQKAELANKRWKFTGPWLAGMTDGDFNRFLEKEVRGKRSEFRAFLRENLAAEMTADQAQKAREAGETAEPPAISASDVTDEEFMDYIRELRQDRMALYSLVGRFLDLAPVDLDTEYRKVGTMAPDKPRVLDRGSPYGADGPPITHPSAGLSYLRTRNFQENHAIYGPQKHHPPVKARVLKPTHFKTGSFRPSIGVAGFVVNPVVKDTMFNALKGWRPSRFVKALHEIELEERGGSKLYVQPTMASVDSFGRICISIDEANPQSEVVQKEMVGEEKVFEQVVKEIETPEVPRNPMNASGSPGFSAPLGQRRLGNWRDGNARNYGF
ncbi:mitochondrial ribosomal protein MRP51 [Hypoxylon rubiginosum]|uniref:Mitochondrial ribosomal protein MRP51 n=1 Tax=Hypoxylon rubiginosum TaxID=110542 RepID=A0ACB9Z5T0_9PEZI|nr:mitochondrial ribosomal protein MRP51 [Hypoxylon rubiginosum]